MENDQDDEIVAEVRRAREAFFKACGGTLEGLYARTKEFEKKETLPVVSFPPRRLNPTATDSVK